LRESGDIIDRMRQVVLYQDEGGAWIAEAPSLPGCRSDGDSPDEAIENVKDAIVCYVEHMRDHGMPSPEERGPMIVECVDVREDEAA